MQQCQLQAPRTEIPSVLRFVVSYAVPRLATQPKTHFGDGLDSLSLVLIVKCPCWYAPYSNTRVIATGTRKENKDNNLKIGSIASLYLPATVTVHMCTKTMDYAKGTLCNENQLQNFPLSKIYHPNIIWVGTFADGVLCVLLATFPIDV